jgi:hypothetical protein
MRDRGGQGRDRARQRWVQQLCRWRDEAEASCEKNVLNELLSTRAGSSPPAQAAARRGARSVARQLAAGATAVRLAGGSDCPPPENSEMEESKPSSRRWRAVGWVNLNRRARVRA